MKLYIIFLSLIAFAGVVNADTNLIIKSDNEQMIKITDLNSFSNVYNNNSNTSIALPYNNYIIDLKPDISNLDNQSNIIMSVPNGILNDRYKILGLGIVVMLIIFAYLTFNKIYT